MPRRAAGSHANKPTATPTRIKTTRAPTSASANRLSTRLTASNSILIHLALSAFTFHRFLIPNCMSQPRALERWHSFSVWLKGKLTVESGTFYAAKFPIIHRPGVSCENDASSEWSWRERDRDDCAVGILPAMCHAERIPEHVTLERTMDGTRKTRGTLSPGCGAVDRSVARGWEGWRLRRGRGRGAGRRDHPTSGSHRAHDFKTKRGDWVCFIPEWLAISRC